MKVNGKSLGFSSLHYTSQHVLIIFFLARMNLKLSWGFFIPEANCDFMLIIIELLIGNRPMKVYAHREIVLTSQARLRSTTDWELKTAGMYCLTLCSTSAFLGLRGRIFPYPFLSLWLLLQSMVFFGLWSHSSNLYFCCHVTFSLSPNVLFL